jgi:hypothetical protein
MISLDAKDLALLTGTNIKSSQQKGQKRSRKGDAVPPETPTYVCAPKLCLWDFLLPDVWGCV